MRALLQRVSEARVSVVEDNQAREVGRTDGGLCIFVCAMRGDGEAEAKFLAEKIAKLRIFQDENAKTNKSLAERDHGAGGSILVVSQFTLAAEWRKGNRPGFSAAADPETGEALYLRFCELLRGQGFDVQTGVFGAEMRVHLVNEGPFTIWMDTADT